MSKTAGPDIPIFAFGKKVLFKLYTSSNALVSACFNANKRQKNKVVIHCTASGGTAEGVINGWNGSPPASAHFIAELKANDLDPTQAFVDVVQTIPTDQTTFHAGPFNNHSVGIEITNVATEWAMATEDFDPKPVRSPRTFTPKGGTAITVDHGKRPKDQNRWLHLDQNPGFTGHNRMQALFTSKLVDFQAYEEEQYRALILLLRHLCIKHRIPRRFLGDTLEERTDLWWDDRDSLTRSRLARFRGVLFHLNISRDRSDPTPAFHTSRVFRGLIDEFWMPVQFDGTDRGYYSGPFDPQPSKPPDFKPSLFRWQSGTLEKKEYRNGDLAALQETKSYYDVRKVDDYYQRIETFPAGGCFPVGTNRVWHGGVHLCPPVANRKIYAAGSGTIVAARLGGDAALEADKEFGSQRFVFIRHAVYLDVETDPSGAPDDKRTDYSVAPKFVFTLYMHLDKLQDLTKADDENPPWFNAWRRRNPTGDPQQVFFPDVEVTVGDWLGSAGTYRDQRMIHFEVVSKEEFTMAPWNDAELRAKDDDDNIIGDGNVIDRMGNAVMKRVVASGKLNDHPRLKAHMGESVADDGSHFFSDAWTEEDMQDFSTLFHNAKVFHKSEWSLESADALPIIKDQAEREALFKKIQPFMWIKAAVKACPDLATQLCDDKGMMWFYHPITFMQFVNQAVQRENGEVSEPDLKSTNVVLEGDFLTRYVDFSSGSAVQVAADGKRVIPFDVLSDGSVDVQYHFTRLDLACNSADHASAKVNATRFHLELLDAIEDVRISFNQPLKVRLAHACPQHAPGATPAPTTPVSCAASKLDAHAKGLAIDLAPQGAATPASCLALFRAIQSAATRFASDCALHAGEPSHGQLDPGLSRLSVTTGSEDSDRRLAAGLTANRKRKSDTEDVFDSTDAASCVFHLEVV